MKVILMADGNTAIYSDQGEEIPQLQRSWLSIFFHFMFEQGIGAGQLDINMPDGYQVRPEIDGDLPVYQVMFLPNGNTAVFNDKGEQVANLQQSWLRMFVHFLQSQGVEVGKLGLTLPDGRRAIWFEKDDNWEIAAE